MSFKLSYYIVFGYEKEPYCPSDNEEAFLVTERSVPNSLGARALPSDSHRRWVA
ncbi:MAG: hypothetical protein K5770_02670 [Lachnospiraceae bacterium]|nr:hypothetical protein [Lachnospiraceae bacterium]